MSELIQVTLIGGLAGILGTGVGGLLTAALGRPSSKLLSAVLAFSGGIMLSVVFQDLIPESLSLGNLLTAFLGMSLGVTLLALLDLLLPHTHFSGRLNCDQKQARFIRTSILLGMGIAMHNLPEGLAIGAGYMASLEIGVALAAVIGLQNVPEGMAMACPMQVGGVAPGKIVLWTSLAGLPMGVGALLGAVVGGVSKWFLSTALGFAAGAMLYVIFDELLPDAQELGSGHAATFGALVGIVVGFLVLTIVH